MMHFIFIKKLTTFLVVILNTQAKTANLTTPTLQNSLKLPAQQKFPQKFNFLLCLAGCTYNLTKISFPALGVHLHPVDTLNTPVF